MYFIDQLYNLIFQDNSGNKIEINKKILKELDNDDLKSFPEGTKKVNNMSKTYLYELLFKDKSVLRIFKIPVDCKIKDLEPNINLFSNEHLKLVLEKSNYKCPLYFSSYSKKKVFIDINDIEKTQFFYDDYIEIKEDEEDYETKITKIFKESKEIYNNIDIQITYRYISLNYNNYFSNYHSFNQDLSENFDYFFSKNRRNLQGNIQHFLSNKNKCNKKIGEKENNAKNNNDNPSEEIIENVYPVCGPHGTGKTITALFIHKSLLFQEIKGIYLNFKYYYNDNISWENKIETLIKECFFIVENKDELLKLYLNFVKLNDFYEVLLIIKEFIEKKSNSNIYMILDQYQNQYNKNNILDPLVKIKVFLLSSINDFDVKTNLIYKYEEELIECDLQKIRSNKRIRYNYIENLIDQEYYEKDKYKNIIRNKIKKYAKDENNIEKELEYVYNILKKFDYLPKYFFRYINNYDSICDLLFIEYSNIIKKLNVFFYLAKIDINQINLLIKNNNLVEKNNSNVKTLTKENFITYLKYIPLKYINFTKSKNGEFYFYYSFPLFKTILKEFIEYIESKELFYITDDERKRGIYFENIVKMELRAFQKLNIDGYLKFNDLMNMNPTKKYTILNKIYFVSKNNIFLDQKNRYGKSFDFGIYKPQTKELILIQSKYIINNNNVSNGKDYYKKDCLKVMNSFNEISKENVEKVYLLFISSYYYNFVIQDRILNILKNKRINCIFYSKEYNYFTFDFEFPSLELNCTNSFMIIPDSSCYKEQLSFKK